MVLGNVVRVTLDRTGSYILSQWIITLILVWCAGDEVFIAKSLILLHCADLYSVVIVVVVGIVVYQNPTYAKTGDYIGDLYWSPIGH